MSKGEGRLLNVGCGAVAPEGWVNVDASPALRAHNLPLIGRFIHLYPEHISSNAIWRDIVAGPPLPANTYELVFASHVLEHLPLEDAQVMLRRVCAALAPGGLFRVIVPDLDAIIAGYLKDAGNGAEAAHGFVRGLGMGAERSRVGLLARFRETLSNARHQWMWTEASLRAELTAAGFTDITRRHGHQHLGDLRFAAVEQEKRHVRAVCLEASRA